MIPSLSIGLPVMSWRAEASGTDLFVRMTLVLVMGLSTMSAGGIAMLYLARSTVTLSTYTNALRLYVRYSGTLASLLYF